ncbi:DUF3800 domain-containing protein [Verrucomicrobium sp. 3C]|uniref:DUF3800 domain-containing protein n=1 Tax=Verrucomicrobium sp. 3C TaxID=1134055 RepID=UPI000382B5A8|nr:DUF3800 domain-containing protein [Verrucomicrobium sp. 3C]
MIGLTPRPKSANLTGLQLADLVATPIGRHAIGKPANEDWRIVYGKFRPKRAGKVNGHGLVILRK